MFKVHRVEREIGGRILSIETGKVAKQADGAVIVRYGETVVIVSAQGAPPRFEDIDFFPLSVDYRERHSAAGKFPGGFIKREGRPSTKEILTARKIDRPIRPLFTEGYNNEVQIMALVLSADGENDPDLLAMIGASAALHISSMPFQGPIAACRVGYIDNQFVVNPTHEQLEQSQMDLMVGSHSTEINMIELHGNEVSEELLAQGVDVGQAEAVKICQMIDELRALAGKDKVPYEVESDEELYKKVEAYAGDRMYELKQVKEKTARSQAIDELRDYVYQRFCPEDPDAKDVYDKKMVKEVFYKLEKKTVRKLLLEGVRPDGRGYGEIRPIDCEIDILPRTHGSALFTRGQTQVLSTVTLGTSRDAQIIDGLLDEYAESFTLHYNFPPYSVGEVRPARGPGRREIGHGALAQKALEPVRPSEDEFAYTIRITSDITESNGSSSMASVCGGSLALMDAGVPMKAPVAGISIGMVSEGQRFELLTDIVGEEDFFGDMDFKVAGTKDGITAIHLDIKAEGLPREVMVKALEQAKEARLKILETMNRVIDEPRPKISKHAPKLISMQIDPELIGKVIGPGGKMIKRIQEETDTTVEIEDDGTVYISCVGGDNHLEAKSMIESLTATPEVGKIYSKSKVVSVKDFGVFVEVLPGIEGLCHISELSDEYIKKVEQVCKIGDIIPVKLLNIDDQGRLRLSRKAALVEMEESDEEQQQDSQAEEKE